MRCTVSSTISMHAEQSSPVVNVSVVKHKINKKCFCRPRMGCYLSETHFLIRGFLITRFTDVLILSRGYPRELQITF